MGLEGGLRAAQVNIRASSEWATLTKFAGAKAQADQSDRKAMLAALKEKQRNALALQTGEHEAARARALEEKFADKLRIEKDVVAYEDMERTKMAERLQREMQARFGGYCWFGGAV